MLYTRCRWPCNNLCDNTGRLTFRYTTSVARVEAEEEQQEFKETNCKWAECVQEFCFHEELVKVRMLVRCTSGKSL